jgi:hypothetical protein
VRRIIGDFIGFAVFTAIYNFVIRKLVLPLGENALLGYGDDKIGQLLGVTTEKVDAFLLEWFVPLALAGVTVALWHFIFMRPKPIQKTAESNPNITYQINHNYYGTQTNITYLAPVVGDESARPVGRAKTQDSLPDRLANAVPQREASTPETFIQFRPGGDIINGANVSSITDNGMGKFTINFSRPLNVSTIAINPIGTTPRNFQVTSVTSSSSSVTFPEPEPQIIGLRFTSSDRRNE